MELLVAIAIVVITSATMWYCIAGYAVLGPYARQQGWAPGPIGDWRSGATGWVLWMSLAIMLGDSLTSLSLLLLTSLQRHVHAMRYGLLSAICSTACLLRASALLTADCMRW